MEYASHGLAFNCFPGEVGDGPTHWPAFTLVELLVVLAVMGVLAGITTLRMGAAADRAAVRSAVSQAAAVFTAARDAAIYRRAAVAVTIDTGAGTLRAYADTVLLYRRDLRTSLRVQVTASRDSMAFDARGLGIGAANLSLVLRRGVATDTLFVSRLGRVRY